MSNKEFSVVIPAYNEEEGIKDVLADVRKNFTGKFNFEVIVVDDGSIDKTREVAQSFGATVISNPMNLGYGASLRKGIEAAKYEYITTIDADATYPVDKIPDLINMTEKGFDMVVGARQGKEYWGGGLRDPARLIFKWMAEFVAGKKIPDINSGLRVIRRSKILPILNELCRGFSFSTSVTLVFFSKGHTIGYIPIQYGKRKGKTKVNYIRDALRTTQILTEIIIKYNPIKLFLLLAFIPLFLGIIFVLFSFREQFNDTLFLAGIVFFCTSLIVFSMGFIAKLLNKF